YPFSLYYSTDPRALHSFPTRRSSDLRVLCDESLWLGCRLGAHRWHVAPVRDDLPAPPPAAIERRSPERLTLELVGLSLGALERLDRKSTRLNSSHVSISYAVFCLKKK